MSQSAAPLVPPKQPVWHIVLGVVGILAVIALSVVIAGAAGA